MINQEGTLRAVEIENWALRVIDRVQLGLPIEDTRVELKAKWIDNHNHVARRIAGHCNANAGDNILWLIGASETDGVVGVDHQDMAKWWPGVVSQFDGQPPAIQEVIITHGELVVVAILFQTDRVPFVVRNASHGQQGGGGGPVEREVPWREATSIRSATHTDLVRLLVPVSNLPVLDVTDATAKSSLTKEADERDLLVIITVYAVVPLGTGVVLPDHQAAGTFSIPTHRISGDLRIELAATSWSHGLTPVPTKRDSRTHTVHQGDQQILLDGPGFFRIIGRSALPNIGTGDDWEDVGPLDIAVGLRPAGSDLSVAVQAVLTPYMKPAQQANTRATYGWRIE